MKNIFKYLSIFCGFVIGLFLFSASQTEAFVFYYDDKTAVGTSYKADGYIDEENGIRKSVYIYGQDVNAGYTVAYSKSKQIRIKSIDVKVGNSSSISLTEGTHYDLLDNVVKNTAISGQYAIKNTGERSNTDAIEIYMDKVLKNFTNYNSSNTITITISLEKKGFCFIGCSWDDYTSINYKNSDGGDSSAITLYKTNSTLLASQLTTRTTGTFNYPSSNVLNGSEVYYNKNASSSDYSYSVSTDFKLTSSSATINYKNSAGTELTSTAVAAKTSGNSMVSNVVASKFSGMFASNSFEKYTFNSISISAKDKYGIQASATVAQNNNLTVATKAPNIDKVELSRPKDPENPDAEAPDAYGAIVVNVKFDMSTSDFTNNSYSYEITTVAFIVGSKSIEKHCSDLKGNVLSSSKSIQKSFTIYSNEATGAIKFKHLDGKLTDKYGNEKTISSAVQLTSSVSGNLTLLSNVEGSEFSSNYTHYYKNDIINFSITLRGIKDTTVSSIALVTKDGSDSLVIYNQTISKDIDGLKVYNLQSPVIDVSDAMTWEGVKLIDVCNAGVCEDKVIDAVIYFNQYKTLTVDATVTNNSEFKIFGIEGDSLVVQTSGISFANTGGSNIRLSGSCNFVSGDTPYVGCGYTNSGTDGSATVTIEAGTIVLSQGQKSAALTFKIVENKAVPTVAVLSLSGSQVYYSSTTNSYYYKGSNSITATLTDGYCGSGKLYYTLTNGEYEEVEFSCGSGNSLSASQLSINLPSEDGTYEFKYYVTSDSMTQPATTHNIKFVARNAFVLDQAIINVNGDPFLANNADDYFNRITIGIDNIGNDSLLMTYRMKFEDDLSYSEATLHEGSNTFIYDSSMRNDLKDLNGEEVTFTITLFDRLGNSKDYTYTLNMDTLTPASPDPRAEVSGTDYKVTISNYAQYSEGDVITILYNTDKEASCTKGVNDTCVFTITNRIYSLQATDRANNTSGVTRYTTEETNATIVGDYLHIYPFLSEVYSIRDDVTIRVVTYAYTTSTISNPANVNRVCTSVTTKGCYTNYYLTSSSMYEPEPDASELNVKISSLKLKSDATYVFLVTLGKSSQYLVNDEDEYPRINMEYVDTVGPELVVNSITSNPLVVSDSPVSSKTFTFNFTITDVNLSSDAKFEYLIINKANVNNYTLTATKFNEYLNYCPRNWSSYVSTCGQWSTESISYGSINGNSASGTVEVSKNGTMINNNKYILFVRAYDSRGNYSILTLTEFTNISKAVDVYYKDGDAGVKTLADTNIIKTENANANIIVELKTSLLASVGVESVKLNGNAISNTYRVGKGIHTLEVKDTLGNVETISIYCGALSKPDIIVYNYYDNAYYEISSNVRYAYNSATINNLWVKVSGTNVQDISVNDGTDTLYDSDDNVFKYLTNADGAHEYGMNLASLIVNTTGTVVISATGDGGEVATITLNVDNEIPDIQILSGLAEAEIYIFDNPYTIALQTGTREYDLEEVNYSYELNYEYLFARLNLVVDNQLFADIKEVSNLIVKLDGVRVTNYTTPIATAASGGTISVEYFDGAGNIGNPLYINLTIVDKEAPVFVGFQENRSVENNVEVTLIDEAITISDNFNSPEDVYVKAYINGVTIIDNEKYANAKNTKYNFNENVQYLVTFVLSDTNGNVSAVYAQTITTQDTKGPDIIDTFTLTGMNLGKTEVISLPRFKDSDKDNTIYYPTVVEFYIGEELVDSSNYIYSFDNDALTIKFADTAQTGNYTILLKAIDSSGNATTLSTGFALTDATPPVINVYVNGVLVEGDSATLVFGDPNFSISYEAIDAHDGKLTVTKTGDTVNVNKQGSYELTLRAKDKSNIQTSRIFTIIVEPDTTNPVINKVSIGKTTLMPSNESLTLYTSVNYQYEYVKVEASDNAALASVSINFDGTIITNNSQVRLVDGKSFTIIVEAKDTTGNTTVATYYVSVDNSAPSIEGVENYRVYAGTLNVVVSDTNLMQVSLYKNDELVKEYTPATKNAPFEEELAEVGQYRIVAIDNYKNEAVFVFEIKETLTANILGEDGNVSEMNADVTYLNKVTLGGTNNIVINVNKNANIGKKDQVYIVISDPTTNNKFIAYNTNGAYFNSQSNIVITGSFFEGVDNTETLESIGETYYAYVMVIKSNTPDPSDEKPTAPIDDSLKSVLIFAGIAILGVVSIILIIKLRRKVRAA